MGTEKCVCILLYKEYNLSFSFFFGKKISLVVDIYRCI